jgi:hypothetical protein
VYKQHPDINTPPDDTTIWRYMDYTKFIAMLEDKALFFTRGDRFRDRFEGSVPKKVAENRLRLWQDLRALEGKEPEDEPTERKQFEQLALVDRRLVAINCWYMDEAESDAMWQLYVKGQGEGVAIQSTVGRLKKALDDFKREIHIGAVEYIDYENDEYEIRSGFSHFLHKRHGFKHEKELRAMTRLFPGTQSGGTFNYIECEPKQKHGLQVPVNLQELIEQIVIAPGAKWLELVTLKVINSHHLRVHVRCTELDADPIY